MANEQLRNAAHHLTHPDVGPVYVPAPSRPARIAALHAAGLFLAENLDLPMPTHVQMQCEVSQQRLQAIADLHGVAVTHGQSGSWLTVPICLETLHGIEIQYFLHAVPVSHQQTTPMDLPARGKGITSDPWADVMPSTGPAGSAHGPADWRDA